MLYELQKNLVQSSRLESGALHIGQMKGCIPILHSYDATLAVHHVRLERGDLPLGQMVSCITHMTSQHRTAA